MATNQQTSTFKQTFDLLRSRFRPHPRLGFFTRHAHVPSSQHINAARLAQGYCMNDAGEVWTALSQQRWRCQKWRVSSEAKITLADSAQECLPPGFKQFQSRMLRLVWDLRSIPQSTGSSITIFPMEGWSSGGYTSSSDTANWQGIGEVGQEVETCQSNQMISSNLRVTPPTDTLGYLTYSDAYSNIPTDIIFGPFI